MQTANKLLNAALAGAGLFLTFTLAGSRAFAADAPGTNAPATSGFSQTSTEWIDAATGHRVIRLSNEPGSLSLYFHQNAYTPRGDKMIIYTPEGLATVNLKTREVELVAPGVRYGPGSSSSIEVGRKTPTVYYEKNEDGQTVIYATDMDTKATRVVSKLGFTGDFGGVNADETLIIGKCGVPSGTGVQRGAPAHLSQPTPQINLPTNAPTATTNAPAPGRRGGRGGGGGGRALQFFAVDVKTGAVRTFFPMTDNLNHDQCSPTDPSLILYCHEGAWDQVDRIWTIRTDGTGNRLMHRAPCPWKSPGTNSSAMTARRSGMICKLPSPACSGWRA